MNTQTTTSVRLIDYSASGFYPASIFADDDITDRKSPWI